MQARTALRLSLVCLLSSSATAAWARPSAASIVCETFPEAAECSGKVVNCSLCHTSTNPAAWNAFGLAVMGELNRAPTDPDRFESREEFFRAALPNALESLLDADSDDDGASNRDELLQGTGPGDAASLWMAPPAPDGAPNQHYKLNSYDPAFAFRRAHILYCGRSPDYEQQSEFAALTDEEEIRTRLHAAVSTCLDSDHWGRVALRELADKRVRPLKVAGQETNATYGGYIAAIGKIYGGVDPKSCRTFGCDVSTGEPNKDVVLTESDIYGIISQALDLDYKKPGMDYSGIVRG